MSVRSTRTLYSIPRQGRSPRQDGQLEGGLPGSGGPGRCAPSGFIRILAGRPPQSQPPGGIILKNHCLAAALAIAALCAATADPYSPDRPLFVLESQYFSFIFPAESRSAAEYLAGFADDTCREIAGLLGTEPKGRLPVVITPDFESINGYYSWFPYPRIVLYQTPVDASSTLGSYNDTARKLLTHELTHAVSMSIRSEFEDLIVSLFGSPWGVSVYLAPLSFVEGVTVSIESLDGFGRAADPLAGAFIRQDILEKRWKSFWQASGAYDLYPYGNLYYLYGGYFSSYLQKRYGMEAYASLWRRFGLASIFRTLDDSFWGPGRFSSVFGVSLSEAWNDFKDSMTIKTPVYMAVEALRGPSNIGALASRGSFLYYHDSKSRSVYSYDTASGSEKALFRTGAAVSRIDVSTDGQRLLLSMLEYKSDKPKATLAEWKAETGQLLRLDIPGMRDAVWMPDGSILGIALRGYTGDLVLQRGATRTTLLAGTESIGYSSPVVADGGQTVYLLARENGVTSLLRLGLAAGTDGLARSSGGASLAGGASIAGELASIERLVPPQGLSWIRYLSVGDDGIVRFSWDDETLYRLAELDGNSISYQTVPASGGVHAATASGGRVYHLGRFSDGVYVCAYPADRSMLGFHASEAVWEDASELLSAISVYDAEPRMAVQPYSPLRWLAPRFWLPEVDGSLDGIRSVGVRFFVADPVERLELQLAAGWNLQAGALDAEIAGSWSMFDWPASFSLSDTFNVYQNGAVGRLSSATLGLGASSQARSGGSLSWNLGGGLSLQSASAPGESPYAGGISLLRGELSPQAWLSAAAVESALRWSDVTAPLSDAEARSGYEASLAARLDAILGPVPAAPSAGIEAGLRGFLGLAATQASVNGAVAVTDGIAYGPGGRFIQSGSMVLAASYPSWVEFSRGDPGRWYIQGEASLRLLGLEIQRGAGAFYANRLSFRLGGRGHVTSGRDRADVVADMGWSVFGRASLEWTPAVGSYAKLHPTSYIEFWLRPDMDPAAAGSYGLSYSLMAGF